MESSDESFTWTHTSNDSSTNESINLPNMDTDDVKYEENVKSERIGKKPKKRKLENEDENSEIVESPKKKKIKQELTSDIETKKKKKKKQRASTENGNEDFEDHDFLNMKVKLEQGYLDSQNNCKSIKNKISNENNINEESYNILDIECKKEKKSKKIKKQEESPNDSISSIEQDYSISPKKKKKTDKYKIEDHLKDHCNGDEPPHLEKKPKKKKDKYIETVETNSNSKENHYEDNEVYNTPTEDKGNCFENGHIESQDSENEEGNTNNVSEQEHSSKKHNNSKRLTPKLSISDRIMYEDDIESNMETGAGSNGISKYHSIYLENFIKKNPKLQQISYNADNSVKITENDEIWILKCPKEVDLSNLNKIDLTLDQKSKLKLNGESYHGALDEDRWRMSVLSPDDNKFTIRSLNVSGSITFRKRLPKPHCVEDNVIVNNQTDFIPLPETKCRHPLFGSDYKGSINVPAPIVHKLNYSNNESLATPSKKKNKKKRKKECQEEVEAVEVFKEESLSDEVSIKKAKKRKNHNSSDISVKKHKRAKRELDSSEVWESEQAIEENLFNF